MRVASWLLAPALAACTTVPTREGLPSYDPAIVTIARETREGSAAVLHREGPCFVLRTFGRIEGARWAPIWPEGTKDAGDRVVLSSGDPLPLGKNLSVEGSLVGAIEVALNKATAMCPGEPFLVASANRSFVWNSAADLVAMSDAALVV